MTIQQFRKIQAEGLFQDFSWPGGLESFSKVNLIYAWNGTGKTTLSRVMNEFGNDSESNKMDTEIQFESETILASELNSRGYQVKVFNSDYISNSIGEVKKGTAEAIYIVGKEAKEIQDSITDIERELIAKENEKLTNENNCNIATDNLENFYSSKAAEIKKALRGTGISQYYDYDKREYKKYLEKVVKEKIGSVSKNGNLDSLLKKLVESNDTNQNSDEPQEPDDLLEKINVSQKKIYDTFNQELPDLALIENEVKDILKEAVILIPLKDLQNNNTDKEKWIKQGLEIYNSENSGDCPWCLQSVPTDRITNLENYFNDSFNKLNKKITSCLKSIDSNDAKLSDALTFNNTDRDLYSEIIADYALAKSEFDKEIGIAKKWLMSIKEDISKKQANIASVLDITVSAPNITFNSIKSINKTIDEHNQKCEDHEKNIKSAAGEYINASISNEIIEIVNMKNTELDHSKLITENKEKIKELKESIEQLQEEAKNAQVPIQELNDEINDFFGHSEIKFVRQENGYIIHRGNEEISELSDGETSIIALLYFLKSLNSEKINHDKLIVVIDDPVSSMDSSNFFRAASFIGERIFGFHQVFIFTHNFVLFRQTLKIAISNLGKERIKSYILKAKIDKDGVRSSTIALLPNALKVYYSEYHFLFESILNASEDETLSLEWHYNLPNMARRLLESFLSFKFPNDKEDLTALLRGDKIIFDRSKKESLIKFLHTYSHKEFIFDPSQEENNLSEARNIIKDLINLIKSLDEEHYNGMVKSLD